MGDYIVFLLKSTCCLTLFYLFFRLLLSRDTFYQFNRLALLSVVALSTLIPCIELATEQVETIHLPLQNFQTLVALAEMPTAESNRASIWLTALFAIYLGGCLWVLMRGVVSVVQIVRLIRSGKHERLGRGVTLVVTQRAVSPFSWFGYMVVSATDMAQNGAEIVAHERAHIQARHSFDLLLAGLFTLVHWFNPAAWLLKEELQAVHEFEADEQVIAHGTNASHYQLLLIKKAVGEQRFTALANSFNHSSLKNRITMMTKRRSPFCARLKYLYVLPLSALALAAFARPEISTELDKIARIQPAETVVTPPTDSVRVVGYGNQQKEAIRILLSDSDSSSIAVTTSQVGQAGQVRIQVRGSDSTKNSPGGYNYEIKSYNPDTPILPGAIRLGKNVPEPLIFVDGKELENGNMDQINPDHIESISVLKDDSAEKLYGEKAKGRGVILITLKKEKR